MDLNLFENDKLRNDFIDKFIEELKSVLNKTMDEMRNKKGEDNILDEYNLYEKKKIFLDNQSRRGNELAWITDDNSVCISEHGDGGPISINEIDLPENAKVGEVYEKIDGKYVYSEDLTTKLNEIKQ